MAQAASSYAELLQVVAVVPPRCPSLPLPVAVGLSGDSYLILDAGKIHPPDITGLWWHRAPRRPPYPFPWEGDLHGPALVFVTGIIDRACTLVLLRLSIGETKGVW